MTPETRHDPFVYIQPCTEKDLPVLTQCAEADNHAVVAPTHIISKGNQITGYIGIIPSAIVWMDTKRMRVRDSVNVLNFIENKLYDMGASTVAIPTIVTSPLIGYLPRVGYLDGGLSRLLLKNLRKA